VKTAAVLANAFFTLFFLCAQGQNIKELKDTFQAREQNSFVHLCGRLEYEPTFSSISRKTHLPRTRVDLFKSKGSEECCSTLPW